MAIDLSRWVKTKAKVPGGTRITYGDGHVEFTPDNPTTPPPPQQNNGLPVDPAYDLAVGAAQKAKEDRLAALQQQRQAGLIDYGYNASYDANGAVAGLAFDPTNPYSRAALMRKTYAQNKSGTQNSYAAQGQLYSGARLNAQNKNDSNFAQGEDSLQKALLAFLAGNTTAERDTNNEYGSAAAQAFADRLGRARDNPLGSDAATVAADIAANGIANYKDKWVVTTWKGTKNGKKGTWRRYADGSEKFTAGG